MEVKRYGVYLAKFHFLESADYKIRPIIIVGLPRGHYEAMIAIPISSRPEREDIDVVLKHWQSSGLQKPSVARLHRLTAVMGSNVLEEIGQVAAADQSAIRQALQRLFGFKTVSGLDPSDDQEYGVVVQ